MLESVLGRGAEAFEGASELGLAGVEVELLGADHLDDVRRAQRSTSLEIPSIVLAAHNVDGGIADADPNVAARAYDSVLDALVWAPALGADVVLVPFFLAADLADENAIDRCAASFRAVCPAAERVGVALCFEGSLAADQLRALAQLIDSPAFGCYFDPANLVVAGLDPVAEALALGPLIRRVHLKDSRERRGDCHLGEGRVDFAACAHALAAVGYDGWLVLETPSDDVARDLSFARSVFPSLRP